MDVDFKGIGKKIKAVRTQSQMTQAELAERTGMSDVYISYIETGTKRASLNAILKIVYVFKISLDSLVYDDLPARLPTIYREFAELLADCDSVEREQILKTASAYKKVLRTAAVLKTSWIKYHTTTKSPKYAGFTRHLKSNTYDVCPKCLPNFHASILGHFSFIEFQKTLHLQAFSASAS